MVVPRAFAARLIQNAPDDAIPPQTVATLHVLLLFESTLPRSYVLIGLVTHGSYYRLLKDFPVVQGSTNPWLISSIVLFVIDNVAWIWHLNSYYYSTMEIMCFGQIFLWLVPFLYLVSLSVNDNVLPGISASQPTATTSTSLRSLFSHFGFGRGADKRTDLPTAASAAQNLPQSAAMRRSRSAGSFASVRHRAAPFPNAGSQNPARLNMDARGSGPSGL